MAIPKFTEDLEIISKLGDNPGTDNNLTAEELRAKFDAAALLIQKFINDTLIPAANASSSPQDGLTMEGPIDMGGQKLSGLNAPADDDDASTKKYVDDHKNDRSNPHGVTAEQVGARPDTWMPTASDVGAVSMKKLWENAAPWNSFAAQTIPVDLSGYDYVEIQYRANTSGAVKSQICKVGETIHLDGVTGSSDGGLGGAYVFSVIRQAAVSSTGVAFTKCVRSKQNSTTVSFEESNTSATPHRIIGIKGVT